MARIRSAQSVIVLRWKRSPLALYIASFLYALKIGILMIVWPWQIMSIGGGSVAVGAIGGVWMAGYVLCCLLISPHADRFGVRRLVMLASAASTLNVILMPMTSSVAVLLGLFALDGAIAGMMWPPITGWLTAGQEGHRLNRRLGMFGLSWSMGAIVGMWLGGPLWGWQSGLHPYPAFVAASCAVLGAFIVAASARKQHPSSIPAGSTGAAVSDEAGAKIISAFRWMAFIAGVIAGMVNGVIRYPIVPLMKSMSLGPSVHGLIAAVLTAATMCGLFLMGRTTRWHHKRMFLWVSQIVMAAAVCAVGFSRNGWELAIFSVVAALGVAVAFASDTYYCLSASTRRTASAAWREIRMSAGFGIGSFGGGAIIGLISRFAGYQTGLRAIYPIMAGIIIAAVLVQAAIYYRSSRNPTRED